MVAKRAYCMMDATIRRSRKLLVRNLFARESVATSPRRPARRLAGDGPVWDSGNTAVALATAPSVHRDSSLPFFQRFLDNAEGRRVPKMLVWGDTT